MIQGVFPLLLPICCQNDKSRLTVREIVGQMSDSLHENYFQPTVSILTVSPPPDKIG